MIPRWVFGVSSFAAALGLFVGVSIYVSPAGFIPKIDFSTEPVRMLAHMWSARQIAIATVIAYSLARRSASNLQIALLAYCLVTFQDIWIGLIDGDRAMGAISALFCLVAASMIYALRSVSAALPRSKYRRVISPPLR